MHYERITIPPAISPAVDTATTVAAQRGAILLSKLDEALRTSDDQFTQHNARALRGRVLFFIKHDNAGMLGPNGVEPQVNGVLSSARFMARWAA